MLFNVLFILLIVGIIVTVISENRNPEHTIAWIIVLTCLPVVGLIVYIFFGMDWKQLRNIYRGGHYDLKDKTRDTISAFAPADIPEGYDKVVNMLYKLDQAYLTEGNDVRIYVNFNEMMSDMIADLESARDHIHFQFFKFENDVVGNAVADVLIRKAQEGVKVRVIFDHAGCFFVSPKFFNRMRKAGVEVLPFGKIVFPFLSRSLNYRNHRKTVIIDGRTGYLGGMNIAKRYRDGTRKGVWRDTQLRVTGPCVLDLQTSFLTDWMHSRGTVVDGDRRNYYPAPVVAGDVTLQLATSGPNERMPSILHAMEIAITNAKHHVYIQSPYLLPPASIRSAIHNAALSGVDVRIMIPNQGDRGMLPPAASRSYVKNMLLAGARVFFYRAGYLHSKAVLIDDELISIGSTNMDVRSFEQNFEINAFIYDTRLAKQYHKVFDQDSEFCEEITLEQWLERPKIHNFLDSVARLFTPIL